MDRPMFELLFAFIEILLEIFFEAAFEFAAESIGAFIWRGLAAIFRTSEFKNPLVAVVGYLLLGGAVGGLSLLFFPHPLVHRSRVPGLSVFASPILAGLGMSLVGSTPLQRTKKPMQIDDFLFGLLFPVCMKS